MFPMLRATFNSQRFMPRQTEKPWATPKRTNDSRKRLSFAAFKLNQLFEIKRKIWAQFNSSVLKATKLMRKFPFYYENCQIHNSGDNLWTLFLNRTLTWVVWHFLGTGVSMPLEEVSSSLTSHKTHSITYIYLGFQFAINMLFVKFQNDISSMNPEARTSRITHWR